MYAIRSYYAFTSLTIDGEAMVFYKIDEFTPDLTLSSNHVHRTYTISGSTVLGIAVPTGWTGDIEGHLYQVTVTFDRNYPSGGTFTSKTVKGDTITKPSNPTIV